MTANIDKLNINYSSTGVCESDECVLFLHGWGANLTLFEGLMATVSKKYIAVALDLPGFGKSDEPSEPWSVDDYAEFVIKFISQLSLKPVALIGHSFGGRLMIKLLANKLLLSVKYAVFIDAAGIKPKRTARQKR